MISVIIPTYKNLDLLVKNLRTNLPFLRECEIIVVNDDPTESIKEDLKEFKNIVLIENNKNLGFGETVNTGVHTAQGDYCVFLNSDVVLQDDSYKKTLKHFASGKIFAVSFAQKETGGQMVGKNTIYWDKGFFRHSQAKDLNFGKTAWAEGGSCIVNKSLFLKLGGFDSLYKPFYWEDIDLSYKAWKLEYEVLFDPAVVVDHIHGSTIGKYFNNQHIEYISYRNQCVFTWLNITSPKFILENKRGIALMLVKAIITGNVAFIRGFCAAFAKLPMILKKKRNFWRDQVLTDEQVLHIFND